jgi:hypothetical protein
MVEKNHTRINSTKMCNLKTIWIASDSSCLTEFVWQSAKLFRIDFILMAFPKINFMNVQLMKHLAKIVPN